MRTLRGQRRPSANLLMAQEICTAASLMRFHSVCAGPAAGRREMVGNGTNANKSIRFSFQMN